MKKITFFILVLLFVCAFFLRSYLLQQNLFFGPEQGIDFLVVKQLVVNHKLTLIGSKTDISGVFHGPIYYYLSSIPFIISHGNPLVTILFFIFLQSLTVFFLYDLGKSLAGKRAGIIAAVIFTVSWSTIVYSRWLSNPELSILLSTLFFVFLYRFFQGSKSALLFAAITLGLLNQAEFLNILFFFLIAIFAVCFYFPIFKKQNKLYLILCAFLAIAISIGPYIIFDLKHQFLMTNSILSLLKGNSGYHIGFLQAVMDTSNGFIAAYAHSIFPAALLVSLIIFASVILLILQKLRQKEKPYLLLSFALLFPPLILILLHHSILDQFFVGFISLYILLTALVIDFLWRKSAILGIILLMVIVGGSLFMWYTTVPQNKNMFFQSTQPDLRYSDQLATIDTIYQEAHGQKFSFQAYTIPYWEQQGWEYLFWSYGQKKYGYLPVAEKAKTLFVIIQDDPSNKPYQQDWLKNTVSKWGKVEKTFKHGVLTIEELRVEKL